MSQYKKQSHVVWKCDYYIVWTSNDRYRVLKALIKDLVSHDIRLLSDGDARPVEAERSLS